MMRRFAFQAFAPVVLALVSCLTPSFLIGQLLKDPQVVPRNEPIGLTAPILKVHPLKYTSAETARSALQTILSADPALNKPDATVTMRFVVDERANSLIVLAEEPLQEKVQEILMKIDYQPNRPAAPQPAKVVHFLVKIILDAQEGDWTSQAVKPDDATNATLQELRDQGIFSGFADPRVVASGALRVRSNGENFTLQSSAHQNVFRMSLNGRLESGDSDEFSLHSKFQIEEHAQDQVHQTQIASDTSLIANHPILLSVNTIQGRNCMIIVELR